MIRASVPKLDLDSSFEQKNDIAKTVESELEKVNQTWNYPQPFSHKLYRNIRLSLILCVTQAMSHYGYEIVQTLIVDIEPDVHVKKAMNEINAGMLTSW